MTKYIDKQSAIDLVLKIRSPRDFDYWTIAYEGMRVVRPETLDKILYAIKKLPDANVAPVVHARWEACKVGPMNAYACSNCGLIVIERNIPVLKYCHQCGARMDGEKE